MNVTLETIGFNHDANLENTGAFNIRRNETQIVALPEWQRERCSNPECSPAAYAQSKIPDIVTIKASFACNDASVKSIQVRALDISTSANILGEIPNHQVVFTQGRSGDITLSLTNATLRDAPIGATNIAWRWQFSPDSVNWTDFQTTKHRIYTVLAFPHEPWEPTSREPSNIHVPWIEVMDYACKWAAGVQSDLNVAADLVTKQVYALGERLVKYQFGASYANARFDCTKFLELLKTGIGGNQTLNCDDCATITSTFANILGCDLFQSGMGLGFGTNPIRLIGDQNWNPTAFLYHAVAWEFPCLATNTLFDGCLQVDGDPQPNSPPHEALQPVQILFGDGRDDAYHFRLVKVNSACTPIPTDGLYGRKQRKLGRGYLADRKIKSEKLLSLLMELYAFNTWPPPPLPNEAIYQNVISTVDLLSRNLGFQDWELRTYERLQNSDFTNIFLTLFTRSNPATQELLAINLYECSPSANPNDFLLQVLSAFEQFVERRLESPKVGDIAFHETGGIVVLFRRGRFVAVIRSAGRQSLSVIEAAITVDEFLLRSVTA